MATEGKGIGEPIQGLDLAESIRQIAAHNARANLNDDNQLLLFLRSWWSRTYNKPLKDPLLQSYTLEELLYEFYDKVERNLAEEERIKNQEVKQEEVQEKDVLDWIDEEERKDADKVTREAAATVPAKPADPTKDPANVKWMEEQIKLAKAELGEDFGEDLELNFDEK
jgi:hypothetical protein